MMKLHCTYARNRLINLLFLLCFVVYAASPLIHPGTYSFGPEGSLGQPDSRVDVRGVSILLLDLFFSKVLHAPVGTDTPPSPVSFVPKTRGIVSGEDTSRLISFSAELSGQQPYSALIPRQVTLRASPEGQAAVFPGYNPLYSGHSPPFS